MSKAENQTGSKSGDYVAVGETGEDRIRRERKEWREERAAYAHFRASKDCVDYDDALREFDEEYGAGPIAPTGERQSSGVNPSDETFGEALSIEFLHMLVGGEITCNGEILAPGPGHSFGDRSMSVRPSTRNDEHFVVHSFSPRTSSAQCRAYVNALYDSWLKERMKEADALEYDERGIAVANTAPTIHTTQSISQSQDEIANQERRIANAKREWTSRYASHILGESVHAHLRSRALELPYHFAGPIVRYQSNGRWYGSSGDCVDRNGRRYSACEIMMFPCRDVLTDEGRAVQLLRLPHIGKGPKRKIHGIVKNTAIKLTPHADILAAGELTVGEGFETCLAAMMMCHRNVWSLVNSDNIADLPLIEGVNKLTILVENGCEANRKARLKCRKRWIGAGREVIFVAPMEGYKDHNDELMALRGVA